MTASLWMMADRIAGEAHVMMVEEQTNNRRVSATRVLKLVEELAAVVRDHVERVGLAAEKEEDEAPAALIDGASYLVTLKVPVRVVSTIEDEEGNRSYELALGLGNFLAAEQRTVCVDHDEVVAAERT